MQNNKYAAASQMGQSNAFMQMQRAAQSAGARQLMMYEKNPHYGGAYEKMMSKPDKDCTDAEIRIKVQMAAEAGDDANLRHIPIERGYGHLGKGEYKENKTYKGPYNEFMMKPDKNCTD